jgi:1-aminocyclopropane-1-carboxylate deaminase/D-cysteine desulfhydrase-like pyridoxal-dependent ACC family enzyme
MESTPSAPSRETDLPLAALRVPSPVRRIQDARFDVRASLWVKDDSRLHPIYGGNKCRKLLHILSQAKAQNKTNVLTFGAAGSHHVLATALFCRAFGLSARAFLIAQPWSLHAQTILRSSVNSGIELIPVGFGARSAATAIAGARSNCQVIAPGGSSVCGSLGYFEAAHEFAAQVRAGEVPEPDIIVVAFGTTGTAAGLWAGIQDAGLRSRILAVSVLGGRGGALYAQALARRLLKRTKSTATLDTDRLVVDSRWVGAGYGIESEAARSAIDMASSIDLPLDPTYTAKAFAAALALVVAERIGSIGADPWPSGSPALRNVLYWHTLGAMSPQLELANVNPIPGNLASLLRRNHAQYSA